jgi:uncharacterized protein YndB with AHSA1/START domain
MTKYTNYTPGPANLAHVIKDEEEWMLAIVRELNHPPEKVWTAITDPIQLREWAPYDSDRSLGQVGTVRLTTAGTAQTSDTEVTRAEPPRFLEFTWGGNQTRWELEPTENGTRLKLWAKINRNFIAMGAAGWHVCLDVLDHLLNANPIGRIVAQDALQFEGWQRLHQEYAQQFGIEPPTWMNTNKLPEPGGNE